MPSIARMNAQLTATAGGFAAGLKAAEGNLNQFRSTFSAVASATAAYDLGKVAIEGAYHATVGLVERAIEAQGALHDQAAALGVTTEALGALQFAARDAGVDGEALAASLGKMEVNLNAAAAGGGPAAKAIGQLGLNAAELTNLAPEVAFSKISEALTHVANTGDRAAIAQAILGKAGRDLIPVMLGGAAGLEQARAAAAAYGFSVSQIDNNKVDDAGDALGHVGILVEGVGNQLAVGLSPYITAAANDFVGLATDGGGVGPKVSGAIQWVTEAIAGASDYLNLLDAGWLAMKGTVLSVASVVTAALDGIGQGVVWLANLLPGVDIEFSGLSDVTKQFAADAETSFADAGKAYDQFQHGANSKKVGDFFAKARADADAAAKASGGPTTGDRVAPDTAAAAQAKADADAATKAAKAVEAQHKSAADAAKHYYEQTRTAAEKYAEEVKRINDLQGQGLLDADTAQRAVAAAQKTRDDATASKDAAGPAAKPEDVQGPQLLQAGSAAAASFVANIDRNQRGDDSQKTVAKNTGQTNKLLAKVVTSIASIAPTSPVIVTF